jgi:hypothetical protein
MSQDYPEPHMGEPIAQASARDSSQRAYLSYRDQQRRYQQQWPHLAKSLLSYEQWLQVQRNRNHPRYQEYVQAAQNWRESSMGSSTFPAFEKWLVLTDEETTMTTSPEAAYQAYVDYCESVDSTPPTRYEWDQMWATYGRERQEWLTEARTMPNSIDDRVNEPPYISFVNWLDHQA